MFSFFFSHNRNLIVFLFLSVLSLSFLSFSSSKFSLTFKEIGETVIYPFRFAVIQIRDGIGSFFGAFTECKALKEELRQKEKQLKFYQEKFLKLESLAEENERLRKLLKYRESENFEVEVARILSRDPESNFSSLTLDKGRKDGILPGMPVFAYNMEGEKGVVGIISESSVFTSKVKTFRNRDFSIGIFLPHSNIHGVAQGLGDNKNIMSLLYIDREISLNLREEAVTSSDNHLFPPGIYVGIVSYIDTTNKTRLTHQAYLKPYIHLSRIQDVFILKKRTCQEQE